MFMANPWQFIKEAKSELTKVIWPTRQATLKITVAVIILSLIVAAYLGAIDFGLTKLFDFFVSKR